MWLTWNQLTYIQQRAALERFPCINNTPNSYQFKVAKGTIVNYRHQDHADTSSSKQPQYYSYR